MKCENCRNELILTKTQKYQYIESGLENIFLDNIEIYDCVKCEIQVPLIPKILRLHNTIGFAIIGKSSLMSGAEIQFLRKNLRVKSQDWAKFLRIDKTTYSRWENGSQKLGTQSDLLIRYLYLRLLEEKSGIKLEKKIVDSLSEVNNEKTAIIINVGQIESYSYLPFAEALRLSGEPVVPASFSFDSFELADSNSFLSEIETPLPLDIIKGSFKYVAASDQRLAAAA